MTADRRKSYIRFALLEHRGVNFKPKTPLSFMLKKEKEKKNDQRRARYHPYLSGLKSRRDLKAKITQKTTRQSSFVIASSVQNLLT